MRLGSLLMLACVVPCAGVFAQPPCSEDERLLTALGERVHLAMPFPPDRSVVSLPPHPGARYLRVRIAARAIPACPWLLTVRDDRYHVVQTLDADDFATGVRTWTVRIPSPGAIFDLQRCPDGSAPGITIDEYVWMPTDAAAPYYSLQQKNKPRYKPLHAQATPTELRGLGDSVGFLMSAWDRKSWACSGVMIADDLFLTNWHCGGLPGVFQDDEFWNQLLVADSLLDLSWDDDGLSREYRVLRCAAKDKALDFAVLEVAPIDAIGPARPARLSSSVPLDGDALVMVHHPAGNPKQISRDCRIAAAAFRGWEGDAPVDFTHDCDTEAGSSGAPVFATDGRLVGLHHLGFALDEATCKTTDHVNKAVRLDAILEYLGTNHATVRARLLVP